MLYVNCKTLNLRVVVDDAEKNYSSLKIKWSDLKYDYNSSATFSKIMISNLSPKQPLALDGSEIGEIHGLVDFHAHGRDCGSGLVAGAGTEQPVLGPGGLGASQVVPVH